MAETKRYYWIKLKDTFLTSEKVDFLMSQKNGANYVVLYQCLCLKCVNSNGELSRTIGEIIVPFDIDKIVRDCKWFDTDTVRVALELYKKLGLIYIQENGLLKISDFNSLIGSECSSAERVREWREKKLLQCNTIVTENVTSQVTQDIRDKILDIRDKSIDIRDKNINIKYMSLELPLNDGTLGKITEEEFNLWKETYPAVDIEQEIKKMIAWSNANPKNRKTKSGYKRFINSWLSRAQDKAPTQKTIVANSDYGEIV